MKHFILFIALFSTAFLYARPRLQFVKQYVVMDTVRYEQKELTTDVLFVNTGDSPLYISDSKVFCPCMNVSYSNEAVLPNDTASIQVTYKIYHDADYRNPVWIYYNTEDPEEFATFTLLGYVLPLEEEKEESITE